MLLTKLSLNNIRSYTNEVINFQSGSTLLSGDIGCGKSTILLAIEFALFGTSRPELPADSLLRKGTNNGSVELEFQVEGQPITIRRNLKREKNGIKQVAGYVLKNGAKKELTAVELKAEIINLLGYPQEYVSKNKNYIFRYTVYTPQEAMKFILQEKSEARLDVLRKMFNVDKYKIVRENIAIFLKKARVDMAVLSSKIEPLPQLVLDCENIEKEKKVLEVEHSSLLPQISIVKGSKEKVLAELKVLEEQQNHFVKLQREISSSKAILIEKRKQLEFLKKKKGDLSLEINSLDLPELEEEQIRSKVIDLEKKKSEIIALGSQLEHQIVTLRGNITSTKKEIVSFEEQVVSLGEKERLRSQLEIEVKEKEGLIRQSKEMQAQFEQVSNLLVQHSTILSQSSSLLNRIAGIDNCPTCLQGVSLDHKHSIKEQEMSKTKELQLEVETLTKRKEDSMRGREENEKRISVIVEKEKTLAKLSLELSQLYEKKSNIESKKELLRSYVQENNAVMKRQAEFSANNNTEIISKEVSVLQNHLQVFTKKGLLMKSLLEIEEQQKKSLEEVELLEAKTKDLEKEMLVAKDVSSLMVGKREEFNSIMDKEKVLSVKVMELSTKINSFSEKVVEVTKRVDDLTLEKNKLVNLQEKYHWLSEFFMKLTYTLEKHIMISIHQHFNSIFQEWFTILIDDENIRAHIDDTFTPVIEQNGYDISFNDLSGGEKTSTALAYRLSLNNVINSLVSNVKTKELLILDEPTDGFSTEQLDKVRDVLEQLKVKQTIIVSHEAKVESFVEHVIRVVKNNHVSSVM